MILSLHYMFKNVPHVTHNKFFWPERFLSRIRFSNWSPISQGRIVSLVGGDTGVISTWRVTNVPHDTWHVSLEGDVFCVAPLVVIILTRTDYLHSVHRELSLVVISSARIAMRTRWQENRQILVMRFSWHLRRVRIPFLKRPITVIRWLPGETSRMIHNTVMTFCSMNSGLNILPNLGNHRGWTRGHIGALSRTDQWQMSFQLLPKYPQLIQVPGVGAIHTFAPDHHHLLPQK